MKTVLQAFRILAIICLVGSWLNNFSQTHKMPITRVGTGFVDKEGKPCTEADYRRGRQNVGAFIVALIAVIATSIALSLIKKPNVDALPKSDA